MSKQEEEMLTSFKVQAKDLLASPEEISQIIFKERQLSRLFCMLVL